MSGGWWGKDKSVGGHEQEPDEVVEGEATVLPAREAMSLISPTPDSGFMPDLEGVPSTDAAAAASGEEDVTSEDRSVHFENRDSATSET